MVRFYYASVVCFAAALDTTVAQPHQHVVTNMAKSVLTIRLHDEFNSYSGHGRMVRDLVKSNLKLPALMICGQWKSSRFRAVVIGNASSPRRLSCATVVLADRPNSVDRFRIFRPASGKWQA